jgi:bifunctional UDP-N-acetylglucosamine pyrophosphorylase/glucosamine-1-phosphate N-acetyltransferase
MNDLHVVVLAAGKGTRMKSSRPKVLHDLAGRPLIEHVLATAEPLGASSTIIVVGHGAADVEQALAGRPNVQFVLQSPQLGTGHAVLQAESPLSGRRGTLLLLYGDVPLLQTATLDRLLERHRLTGAEATVLTTNLSDPSGYGRIVRDGDGRIARIVEERDASADERAIREINSGIYVFEIAPLFPALHRLAADNAQGEYYLTDLVAAYRRDGRMFETLCLQDPTELRGVNSRIDLADLAAVLFARKRRALMLDGVSLQDPATTYVDDTVEVGADTVLAPGVTLTGTTRVGARCHIHPNVRIADSVIGDDVTVLDHSIVVQSVVGSRVRLGPFAHLRPHSRLADDTHVGNFVELKNTSLGRGSKANHLAYLGDAAVGERVNVGAGAITCNYDGTRKHPTVIEDDVFIGSDSQLVAPVTIGRGSYVAAGSSITEDVPPDSLAVARARQTNKPGWANGRRAKKDQP